MVWIGTARKNKIGNLVKNPKEKERSCFFNGALPVECHLSAMQNPRTHAFVRDHHSRRHTARWLGGGIIKLEVATQINGQVKLDWSKQLRFQEANRESRALARGEAASGRATAPRPIQGG